MQKIVPHLWFNNNCEEAAVFYSTIFKNSKIGDKSYYGAAGAEVSGMKKGSVMSLLFEINEEEFVFLNGGPVFKFTPAISFIINFNEMNEIEGAWKKLSKEGKVLMEFQEYPFSKKYGWIEDKFGVSWQLIFDDKKYEQKFIPTLMFVQKNAGKAENAIKFYISIFENSKINNIYRYEKNEISEKEGTIKHGSFIIENQYFAIMDSSYDHKFNFNESISFIINCKDQKEIDYYWEKLSFDPKSEQCGWLKDKFGVSWQVVPERFGELMKDNEKSEKVMEELLKMKKIDFNKLMEVAK